MKEALNRIIESNNTENIKKINELEEKITKSNEQTNKYILDLIQNLKTLTNLMLDDNSNKFNKNIKKNKRPKTRAKSQKTLF